MSWLLKVQADDFFNAYQVLKGNYNTATLAIMGPSIVVLAFAVELYVKDVHVALTGIAPKGHDILKLFKELPEPIKKQIFSHPSISQNPFHTRGPAWSIKKYDKDYTPYDGFIDQLEAISNAFVDWRYSHEGKRGSLNYNSSLAEDLIEAVKSVARNIRSQKAA
jgi:HEPN domain-containing protein